MVRNEEGFTLVELLVVMVIMAIVMTAVVSLYLSGTRAQVKINATFQAQGSLHVGVDKLRRDVHLACSQTAQSATSVTLSLPPCDGTVLVTWCTQGSGTNYGLYRIVGSSCTGGVEYADLLTGGSIFSYLGPNSPSGSHAAARVHIDMTAGTGGTSYRFVDDLVFRNSTR
jgi:prepilin-type N-terminal cleavage/methylation domain-containing protein